MHNLCSCPARAGIKQNMISNCEQSQTLLSMCSSCCTCVPVGAEPGGDGIWQSKAVEMRPCHLCFHLLAPAPLGCLMPCLSPSSLLSLPQLCQPSATGELRNCSKVGQRPEATLPRGLCYLGNASLAGLAPKGELLLTTGRARGIKHPLLRVRASAGIKGTKAGMGWGTVGYCCLCWVVLFPKPQALHGQ